MVMLLLSCRLRLLTLLVGRLRSSVVSLLTIDTKCLLQDTKVLKRWNPNAEDPIPSPITIDVGPSQVPRPSISPSNSRKMLLGDPLRTRPRGLGYSTRLARAQTDSQIVAKALPTLDVKAALMDVAEGDEEGAVEKSPSRFPRKGWSDSVVWTGHGPDMNFSPSFNKVRTRY